MVGPKGHQQERWLNPGDSIRDLPHAPEMVLVPPGKFWMGSKGGEGSDDERPRHEVTIRYPLLAGKFPVKFDEWNAAVTDRGVSQRPDDKAWGRGDRPVVNVSWEDAIAYAGWLATTTGKKYRLLSEAEWEHACHADSDNPYTFGHDARLLRDHAWFSANSGARTQPVGYKKANNFGLYDMHGNVWEWCEDCWHHNYNGAPADGSVWLPNLGSDRRVIRGGSWKCAAADLHCAARDKHTAKSRRSDIGFRVARTLSDAAYAPAKS